MWLARYAQPSLEAALASLPVEFRLVEAAIPDLGELTAGSDPSSHTLVVLDDLMYAASGAEQI